MFPTIPPIPPKYIPIIREVAKMAWKWLKNKFSETAEDTGKLEPVTSESTIEDIVKINEIFNSFKESIEIQSTEIESKIIAEISYYADELCFAVEGSISLLSKYKINSNRFKRQIEKLNSGIGGTMQKEVSKRISLDNPDCKRVVKMLPGSKKEEEFKLLLIAAINAGIVAINEKVELIVANIIDDFEFALNDCIELIEKESNSQIRLLADAELQSIDFIEMKEIIKNNADLIICSCELIQTIVGEEV